MPAEDIKNLFSRFGNRSGQYREIVRDEQTVNSIERWPLLSTVEANRMRDIPGVSHAPAVARTLPANPAPLASAPAAAAPAPAASPAGAPSFHAPLIVKVMPNPSQIQTPQSAQTHFSTAAPASVAASATRPAAASSSFAPTEPAPAPIPSALPSLPGFFSNPPAAAASARSADAQAETAAHSSPAAPGAASAGRPFPNFEVGAHHPLPTPSASLSDMFGRLAGPQAPEAPSADQRPIPAFRRLRRS